jgi:hypothetical protein
VFVGDWSLKSNGNTRQENLPKIADNFEKNYGDATVQIISVLNVSSMDLYLLEGEYIDEQIKITIPETKTISKIIDATDSNPEEITILF